MKLSNILISAVALSVLGLAGCERLEPASDHAVGLQASGYFDEKPASLSIQESLEGLKVEVRSQDNQEVIVSGWIQNEEIIPFLAAVKGPMISSLVGTTLRVTQSGKVHRSLNQLMGSAAKAGAQAGLDIEGTRWITYNSGLLEHGMEGHIRVTLKKGDGGGLSQFEGLTTHSVMGAERVAVGVNVKGQITGDTSLGGGLLSTGVPAQLYMALPNGAGAVIVSGFKQTFVFDPNADMRNADGEIGLLANNEKYLELSDKFKSDLKMGKVDLGNGKNASSTGNFNYDLSLAVTPDKILVTGKGGINAFLTTEEGKKAEFHGHNDHIQTELDW